MPSEYTDATILTDNKLLCSQLHSKMYPTFIYFILQIQQKTTIWKFFWWVKIDLIFYLKIFWCSTLVLSLNGSTALNQYLYKNWEKIINNQNHSNFSYILPILWQGYVGVRILEGLQSVSIVNFEKANFLKFTTKN